MPAPTQELLDEALLEEALIVVGNVAGRLAWQLGGAIPREDLLSIGHFAVVELIRRWDPERAPLGPYLRRRLKWAMLDGVRRETHGRALARAGALRASSDLGEPEATEGKSPASENTYQGRLRVALREHALAMGIKLVTAASGGAAAVADSSVSPERLAHRRSVIEALHGAVAGLGDPRQRELIQRIYFRGETLTQVAADLELSKGWASRLHRAAMAELARALQHVVSSR